VGGAAASRARKTDASAGEQERRRIDGGERNGGDRQDYRRDRPETWEIGCSRPGALAEDFFFFEEVLG